VLKYVVRRMGQAVIVLLLVSLIMFVLLHAMPGGLVRAQLGPRATRAAVRQLTRLEGLTKPLPLQYGIWLWNLLHGNLGFSYRQNSQVATLLIQYFPRTLILGGISLLLTVILAIPLGVLQGSRANQKLDYGITGGLVTLYSLPTFLKGAILILVFSVVLGILPDTAQNYGRSFGTDVTVLILPILTLTLGSIAYFSRYIRSSVVDNLDENYVRTARAKGVGRRRLLVRHVLRNALLPFVSVVGISLPTIISGTLIIEFLFDYPGLGLLYWDAQQTRTFPIMLGIVLLLSVFVVVGNLLADLAYAALDPRIRYG
jgi:peptide/nickel transport system permease protein